jgi:predicted metal-dependent hydrolase
MSPDFPYTITYTHNRNAYIRVSDTGTVLFTIPQRCKNDQKLFNQLLEKAELLRKRHQTRPKVERWNEEGLLLFGEWISRTDFLGENKKIPSSLTLEKKLKEILHEYSTERLDIFSEKVGKKYRSLSIRKAKSKRGSCSHDQHIMLNLSLIYLPRDHIQYVIAHEVAHLVEKNHSSDFWDLVEKLFPDYKTVRKSLKKLIVQ